MGKMINAGLTMIVAVVLPVCGQTVYTGTVGKAAVDLVVSNPYTTDSQPFAGVYLYKKYNNPIPLGGIYKNGTLFLCEHTEDLVRYTGSMTINGTDTVFTPPPLDDLVIPKFNDTAKVLTGYYFNSKKNSKTPIKLVRQYDLACSGLEREKQPDRELLQAESGCGVYFKIRVSCGGIVTGVRVLSIGSGETVQFIDSSEFQVRECHDCDVSWDPSYYFRNRDGGN